MLLCAAVQAKTVRLITIGPGDEFWSAFGHTALAIDQDVYGFGYFSFEQEGLIQAFIDNQMYYDLGLSDLNEEVQLARWQNRSFWVQELDLNDEQIRQLEDHLSWYIQPANLSYHYDYFDNNCSTKIRDLLDDVWQGALKQRFDQPTELNYFQLTVPAKQQSWMNLGIALGYGWEAYAPRTVWELMAFPEYFYAVMESSFQEHITTTALLYEQQPIGRWQHIISTHGAILGIFLAGLLLLAIPRSRRPVAWLLVTMQSLVGTVLLVFWLIGGYPQAAMNINLLLFAPWALAMVKWPAMGRLLLLGYLCWAGLAMWLGAWYLTPFLVLHVLAVWLLGRPVPSNIFKNR